MIRNNIKEKNKLIKVEDVKQYKLVSDELLQELKDFLVARCNTEVDLMEDLVFLYNGKNYSFELLKESAWDDQGKYQYQDVDYILKDEEGNYMNVMAEVVVTRSGSYFSEYDYEYDIPVLYTIGMKTVPEQVIPEHEVVVYDKA